MADLLTFYGQTVNSRFLIGSALYSSPEVLEQSIKASGSEIITVSLRRQSPNDKGGNDFWQYLQNLNCQLMPNTAGCHSAKEAITLAKMSRELFGTDWIKRKRPAEFLSRS